MWTNVYRHGTLKHHLNKLPFPYLFARNFPSLYNTKLQLTPCETLPPCHHSLASPPSQNCDTLPMSCKWFLPPTTPAHFQVSRRPPHCLLGSGGGGQQEEGAGEMGERRRSKGEMGGAVRVVRQERGERERGGGKGRSGKGRQRGWKLEDSCE